MELQYHTKTLDTSVVDKMCYIPEVQYGIEDGWRTVVIGLYDKTET